MTTKIPVELSSTPGIVDGSNATAITIDSSERVGIGTSSPSYALDVRVSTSGSIVTGLNLDAGGNNNGDGSAITFSRAGNVISSIAKISAVKAEVSNNETDLVFSNYAAGSLTEKMRIVGATGNVGIGDTSPDSRLHLTTGSSAILRMQRSNNIFGFESGSTASGGYGLYDYAASAYDIYLKAKKVGIGTTSPGCLSGGIHAVHANAEGTPTFDGGEVLILQRNFNSSQSCSMSMVAGTNAACTINMGDKDDVNRSFITSNQGTDTMGFSVATGTSLEIVSSRGGGSGRTVSATGNGGLCFGASTTNTGGCIMAAADNAQSEGIVFYMTASASEWQPASIVAHCSKVDTDQSDHNYGNVAYGFSLLAQGDGSIGTVQQYEANPSGGAGITWSLNDLGGTTIIGVQILATSNNSTGPRITLTAWATAYSGVLEANRS
jgi:hypothetical protein